MTCPLRDENGVAMNSRTHSQDGFAFLWVLYFLREKGVSFRFPRGVFDLFACILPLLEIDPTVHIKHQT